MKPVFAVLLSFAMISNLLAQLPDYLPQDGLVAWYPFNGNANDESGNDYHGINSGATLTMDRFLEPSSAYSFAGDCSDRIDIEISQMTENTEFTVSFWAKRNGDGCLNPRLWEFYGGERTAQCGWFNDWDFVTFSGFPIIDTSLENGEWYHLALTNDGVNWKAYINGSLNNIQLDPSIINSPDLAIGRMNHSAWDSFNGMVDDFGIWNRALSAAEISGLFLLETVVLGCTDVEACNYDSEAVTDDGSCAYAPSILQSGVAIGDTIFTVLNQSISLSSNSIVPMDSILLDEFSVSFNAYSAHSLPVSELSKQYRLIATGRYGFADGWSHNDAAFSYRWDVDTGTKVNCNGTQDAQDDVRWRYDGNANFQRPDNDVDNNDLFCSGIDKTYYWTIDGDGNSHTVGFLDGGGYGDNSGSLDFSFYELIPANLVTWPDGSVDSTWTYPATMSGTFNLSATQNGCSTNFVVVVGEPGCMDSTACNYSQTATYDDGSCVAAGCTDATACNYDAAAGCDDGSCAPAGAAEGCTDSSACNYDATLVCDDGSCVYPPLGLSDCNAGATLCGAGTTFNVATQQCLPTTSSPSSSSCLTCEDLIEEEQVGNRFYRSIDTEEILEQCDDN